MRFVWFFTPPGLDQVVNAGRPRKAGEAPPANIGRPANIAEVLQ